MQAPIRDSQQSTLPETIEFPVINLRSFHVFEAKEPLQSIFAGWSTFLESAQKEPMKVNFQGFRDSINRKVVRGVPEDLGYSDALIHQVVNTIDLPIAVFNYYSGLWKLFGGTKETSPDPRKNIVLFTDGAKFRVVLSEVLHVPGVNLFYDGSVAEFLKRELGQQDKLAQVNKEVYDSPKILEFAAMLGAQQDTIQPLLELSDQIREGRVHVSSSSVSSALTSVLHLMQMVGYDNQADVPTFILLGTQSHGKSAVLSRLLQVNVAYSSSGTATKRPVFYVMMNSFTRDPEFFVYNRDHITKVSRLEEVISVLDTIMELEPSLERIMVLNKIPGILGSRFFDMIGLVHNQEGPYKELSQLAITCSAKYFSEYIVRGNKRSCAIFTTKVGSEAAEITWPRILNSEIRSSTEKKQIIEDQSIFVLTHGDQVGSLIDKGQFSHCQNWKEVEEVLFASIKEVVGTANIKGFLMASAPMSSKDFAKRFAQDPRGAVEEYRSWNSEKEMEMRRALLRIAENEGFEDDDKHRQDFFAKTKVDPIIKDLSLRCFSGVLELGPKFIEELDHLLTMTKNLISHAREERAKLKARDLKGMAKHYLRDFVVLQVSLFSGQDFMAKEVNPTFNVQTWTTFRMSHKKTHSTIKEDWVSNFPYIPGDVEGSKQFAEAIDSDLQGHSEESSTGAVQMVGLLREVFVKTLLIKPKPLQRGDLDSGLANGVVGFNMMNILKCQLNIATEKAGKAISRYLGERVVAILREQTHLVRQFMIASMDYASMPQQLQDDIAAVLNDYFDERATTRVRQMVDLMVEDQLALIDLHGPILNDVTSLLNPVENQKVENFCQKFPHSPFARLFGETQRNGEGLKKVVTAVKTTERFISPPELVHAVYQLMSMTTSPDTFMFKNNLFLTSDEDVVEVNYAMGRVFSSRFLDISRGIYRGLHKFITDESAGAIIAVRHKVLFNKLKEYVLQNRHFDRVQDVRISDSHEEGSQADEGIKKIFGECYDPSRKLIEQQEEKINRLSESASILQRIRDASETFFDFLEENKEEIAKELVSLPQNITMESTENEQ